MGWLAMLTLTGRPRGGGVANSVGVAATLVLAGGSVALAPSWFAGGSLDLPRGLAAVFAASRAWLVGVEELVATATITTASTTKTATAIGSLDLKLVGTCIGAFLRGPWRAGPRDPRP
jgi:hypothetical protein